MGLLNQLHLFIHQNWSQIPTNQKCPQTERACPESLLPTSDSQRNRHGSWMGMSLLRLLHVFPPCALISLMLNGRSSCWMDRQTERSFLRNSTAQKTASFSLLNNLVLFTGQNSINSESAGWFLVSFLSFWAIHPMPWGNKGPGIMDSLQLRV